jgi:hypothetical protein
MLGLSKDRTVCPENGGSKFLHPVVNKQLEIAPFRIPEDSNYELIKFANHIFCIVVNVMVILHCQKQCTLIVCWQKTDLNSLPENIYATED